MKYFVGLLMQFMSCIGFGITAFATYSVMQIEKGPMILIFDHWFSLPGVLLLSSLVGWGIKVIIETFIKKENKNETPS